MGQSALQAAEHALRPAERLRLKPLLLHRQTQLHCGSPVSPANRAEPSAFVEGSTQAFTDAREFRADHFNPLDPPFPSSNDAQALSLSIPSAEP